MADTESLSNYTYSSSPRGSQDEPRTLSVDAERDHGCLGGKVIKTCGDCSLRVTSKGGKCKSCNGFMMLQTDCDICQSIKKHASKHLRKDSALN